MQLDIKPPLPPGEAWAWLLVPPLPLVPPAATTNEPKEVFPPLVPGLPLFVAEAAAPPDPVAPTVIVTLEGISLVLN
jgi:hypothetical protein